MLCREYSILEEGSVMSTALVTGGAVRLGRAMVLHLAERGYDIALHYETSEESAEQTADSAREEGVRCETYSANFTNFDTMAPLIDRVLSDFDSLNLLVNSAANFIQESLEATSDSTLIDTININLTAPFVLMREYKKKVNGGLIINILDERILRRVPTFCAR